MREFLSRATLFHQIKWLSTLIKSEILPQVYLKSSSIFKVMGLEKYLFTSLPCQDHISRTWLCTVKRTWGKKYFLECLLNLIWGEARRFLNPLFVGRCQRLPGQIHTVTRNSSWSVECEASGGRTSIKKKTHVSHSSSVRHICSIQDPDPCVESRVHVCLLYVWGQYTDKSYANLNLWNQK